MLYGQTIIFVGSSRVLKKYKVKQKDFKEGKITEKYPSSKNKIRFASVITYNYHIKVLFLFSWKKWGYKMLVCFVAKHTLPIMTNNFV